MPGYLFHYRWLLPVGFCLLLAGCNSVPTKPVDELEAAARAIDQAERADAGFLAPEDFQRARETQKAAVAAAADNEFDQARYLASLASVQAELAKVRAQRIQAETNLERLLTQME